MAGIWSEKPWQDDEKPFRRNGGIAIALSSELPHSGWSAIRCTNLNSGANRLQNSLLSWRISPIDLAVDWVQMRGQLLQFMLLLKRERSRRETSPPHHPRSRPKARRV